MEQFRQEVRALNTQFAAYVSRQSRENGDKLWESGLRDYLTYAAKVRQEYKDVLVATGSSDPSSPAGNIFVMGQGDMNQLGLGEDVTEVYVPTVLRIEGGLRVTKLALGGMHTLALTEGGVLFSWGVNDEGGLGRDARGGHLALQQGETQGSESVPDRVRLPNNEIIEAISAGDSHSCAVDSKGSLFGWGCFRDSGGKFGFSSGVDIQHSPTLIKCQCFSVTDISSGTDHVLALTKAGQVLSWGCAEQGRLGRVASHECDAKTVKGDKAAWKTKLLSPSLVPAVSGIVAVGTGSYTSFAIAGGGQVLAWGINNYGQLGIQAEGDAAGDGAFFAPAPVPSLSGKRVTSISGGEHHTLAVTEGGSMLSFGRPTYGRLGRTDVNAEEDARVWQPKEVHGLSRVVAGAAGLSVSAAITADGHVYAWGSAGEALLGKPEGDEADEVLPRKIEGLKGGGIAIGFGGQHAAILVSSDPVGGPSQKRQR